MVIMFTGIITHVGKLSERENSFLTFEAPPSFLTKTKKGDSVAVNGACLTVVKKPTRNAFLVEVMPETAKQTALGTIHEGTLVNLELPATPETFLSGHIVQGHVDGLGKVEKVGKVGNSKVLTVTLPKRLHRYVVSKGSIAVNGVSLTVIDTLDNAFTVGIIPYTWKHTTFQTLRVGDYVNIETDIFAKYIYYITRS